MKARLVILAAFLVAACDGPGKTDLAGRFTGMWLVDQPFHALYEATVYDFASTGSMRALNACDFSLLSGDAYVTGTVANESGVVCRFGNTWQSSDPTELLITGACDDAQARTISLGFSPDTSQNTIGTSAVVRSVAGEATGWDHRDWAWQWTRCPDAGCAPVWTCP